MEPLSDVRALTFDVFGTVVDWRSGIAREGRVFGERHGISLDWSAFADRWRDLYQPSLSRVRDGAMPWTRLDDLHRTSLLQVLEEFGAPSLSDDQVEELNRAWHRRDPWPDVVQGMTRLKSRFILTTLSNGNVSLMVNMAKRAGLPWDAVLGAEVARAYKPQPEAYLTTARFLDLPPARCLMVAAHHSDLDAARACGYRTAFVARPAEYGPTKQADAPRGFGHDIEAADFGELASRLGC